MSMPRSALRVFVILNLILLAVFVPLTRSEYAGLDRAKSAASYLEAAGHYENATQRISSTSFLYPISRLSAEQNHPDVTDFMTNKT
jgi:hypothetical protein